MQHFKQLIERAKAAQATIVLPEASDPRILQAAAKLCEHNIAKIILPGDPRLITQTAKVLGCDISAVQLLDISTHSEDYAQTLFAQRQHKGLTHDQARQHINDPLTFANIMVQRGEADGCVAGAQYPPPMLCAAPCKSLASTQTTRWYRAFLSC